MTDPLEVTISDGIATVSINRPERRNSISLTMYQRLPELLGEVDENPEVRVILLRGRGEAAFSAGADISEFSTTRGDAATAKVYNGHVERAETTLQGLRKPTIAVIHGYCIGGGCGLAACCDLRLAAESARFAVTPAKVGLVYSFSSTKRLVDLIGPSRTKWLLMSGEQIDAATALAWGLVDELWVPAELDLRASDLAQTITSRAQASVSAAKQLVQRAVNGQSQEDADTRELRDRSFETADYAEGVAAFVEKRPPTFTWA